MPNDEKTRTTITLDKDLKHEITMLAVKDSREFSAEISVLLREAISARKVPRRAAASAN